MENPEFQEEKLDSFDEDERDHFGAFYDRGNSLL